MVHFTDTVVTLKDLASGRPFREFDHHRASSTSTVTVKMPFDTEYGITLKTMDYGRRRMEVTIDGTQVADLIFQGGPGFQQTLERFMDSDKRFKFVKATSAAVADPTNPSNGDIVVKVWRENAPQSVPICAAPRDSRRCGLRGSMGGVLRGMSKGVEAATPTCGGVTVEGRNAVHYSADQLQVSSLHASHVPTMGFMDESAPTLSMNACYTAQQPAEEKGATVEGSASGQKFGHTTWAGDLGFPSVFVFKLRAPAPVAKITAVYCSQCGFAGGPEARFCAACGSPLAILTRTP